VLFSELQLEHSDMLEPDRIFTHHYELAHAQKATPRRYDGTHQVRAVVDLREAKQLLEEQRLEESRRMSMVAEREKQASTARAGGFASLVAMLDSKEPGGSALAVRALKVQSMDPASHVALAEAGAIEALTALLVRGTSQSVDEMVARTLWNISSHADNKLRVARSGAIAPFVSMLRNGSPNGREIAAGALRNLAMEERNWLAIREASAFEPLIALLDEAEGSSTTKVGRKLAAAALRELSTDQDLKRELIEKGCPGSPALRRTIAGDTLIDPHVFVASKAASSFFAPSVDECLSFDLKVSRLDLSSSRRK